MKALLLARHGESVFGAAGVVNGDPSVPGPLTEAGREQARALGEALRDEEIDLCAVTPFERVQETADLALAGRDVPRLVVPELSDPGYGSFEGGPLDAYREWVWTHGPLDAPSGGESRAEIAARYARGLRLLLGRPERRILLVAHSLTIRYALNAAAGRAPQAKAELVELAVPFRLDADELAAAVELLEAWCAAPVF